MREPAEVGLQRPVKRLNHFQNGGRSQMYNSSVLDTQCQAGQVGACIRLGQMYASGQGMPKDMTRAVAYAKRACALNDVESCGNVGGAYFGGTGVPQNRRLARQYLEQACRGGSQRACAFLKK